MVAIVCFFSVGYAAFSSNFLVSGKGTIIEAPITIDELREKKCNAVKDDGLYIDTYEDGRCIYKGANPDNFISFNNELWRIISIDNDNSLKIIRNESIGTMAFDSQGFRDNSSNGSGGTYCFNSSFGCNAWAKSDNFINISYNGTVLKDSEINSYLNQTYYNSLLQYSKSIIQIGNWSIGPVTIDNNNLSTQIELENSIKWNGNVGLISVSEALRANSNAVSCGTLVSSYENRVICKDTNYLVPTSGRIWTISPVNSISGINYSAGGVNRLTYEGNVGNAYAYSTDVDVRPVVYLNASIRLNGKGTEQKPYIIVS